MTDRLPDLIDAFAGRRVLVIGDAMLDGYLEGACGRVCPEAPVPVVDVCQSHAAPGGAANAAANARSLGADVTLLGLVGADAEAGELVDALSDAGVSPEGLVIQPGRRTLAKRRVVAAGQVVCRLDQGDTGPADESTEAELVRRISEAWDAAEAVMVSDYGYGVLTPAAIAALADLQRHSPRVVVADSKRLPLRRSIGPTAVKPNFAEAVRLLGLDPDPCRPRAELVANHGPRILELTGARLAAVTLDTEGAVVFERGRPAYRTYAEPHPHSRASGAGDTYTAALALALAVGADGPAAAELAAAAAAVVVGKDGTARCIARELRSKIAGEQKVTDREGVIVRLAEERRRGRRVVLTNGCFDILHRGHVTYLTRAKALGDRLVVGVNTDAGIRRLKGPERPINSLDDRVQVLAALSCVDVVVPFDEDTPHELIRAVRPDVFVKGGDYTRDRLPEAGLVEELGGEVRILSFVADRSTTGLIEKIRAADGPLAPAGRRR
jgi:D-beta-D-heptose 7-phosphate kinase/D-beta-D-heptose 1-phosphate adenosyltransferase